MKTEPAEERVCKRGLQIFLGFVFLGLQSASATSPEAPLLESPKKWVVIASRHNRDEAVGVARRFAGAKVFDSKNSWYAIVIGPVTAERGQESAALAKVIKDKQLPADSFLSNGDGLTSLEWEAQPAPFLATTQYDGKNDVQLTYGQLTIRVHRVKNGDGTYLPEAIASLHGQPAFTLNFPSDTSGAEFPEATLSSVWLDKDSPQPQIILSYFWGGAHCCTVTKIATEDRDGKWYVVDGSALDGDGGYGFEHLDVEGNAYLVSIDQNFLYAFAPYAMSYAPIRIQKLRGTYLRDVTKEPFVAERVREDYFGMSSGSDVDWHNNGFLAAWVADSILVGKGREAWEKMLTLYDHNPDFASGLDRCRVDMPLDKCPSEKVFQVQFPEGLRQFLFQHGYIGNTDFYPISSNAVSNVDSTPTTTPTIANAPPQSGMQTCVSSLNTVRQIILRVIFNRNIKSDASNAISISADTTVESIDSNIGKVTCACSYTVDFKKLASTLLEQNEYVGAKQAISFARRYGSSFSARIKFTVKPTQTPGQTWVELLR